MQQTQNQGRSGRTQSAESASQLFVEQLEESRRANDVKKLLLGELFFFVVFSFSSLCYMISNGSVVRRLGYFCTGPVSYSYDMNVVEQRGVQTITIEN
jgi:hypothetical protein